MLWVDSVTQRTVTGDGFKVILGVDTTGTRDTAAKYDWAALELNTGAPAQTSASADTSACLNFLCSGAGVTMAVGKTANGVINIYTGSGAEDHLFDSDIHLFDTANARQERHLGFHVYHNGPIRTVSFEATAGTFSGKFRLLKVK
jgi:hypothetical protein